MTSTRDNNFDLVRVLAALQVLVFHVANHMGLTMDRSHPLVALAGAMPGVPMFFVVSGFLITLSWERNPDLRNYARNRALRIYPALWVCLVLSIASAAAVGRVDFARADAVPWLIAQLTFGQFYNPDFLRGYGVGSLNGSLWTIPVELQFYALVPLLYAALGRMRGRGNLLTLLIAVASVAAQAAFVSAGGPESDSPVVKLFGVSIVPNLWMFMVGVLAQRNFATLERWLKGKALYWLVGYALLTWLGRVVGVHVGTNQPNPLLMLVLGSTTLSMAFTMPGLSRRVLRGNDVSYGAYIYHAVVLNVFLVAGVSGSWYAFAGVFAVTAALAIGSWLYVERPAMRYKRNPLHRVQPSG